MEKIKILEDVLGKDVIVWTINQSFRGKVEEIEGEWLKIVSNGKKVVTYILKTDMITSITVNN